MSTGIQIAQAMADRLNALATLPDVHAIVWKQKDITSELQRRTGKTGGALIVILYAGFINPDTVAGVHLSVTRRYTVSVFSQPVLRGAASTTADDIVEIVARSLHNWEPDEATTGTAEIRVASCDIRPDNQYLIYDLEIETTTRL
jgi:hypothetical protein